MLSSGLSSKPPSASFLKAIDNLTFVTQHLRDGKTHHTEKFIGELCMKKKTRFVTVLGKHLLLFDSSGTRLNITFKIMLFLTSSHPPF